MSNILQICLFPHDYNIGIKEWMHILEYKWGDAKEQPWGKYASIIFNLPYMCDFGNISHYNEILLLGCQNYSLSSNHQLYKDI